MKTIRNVKNSVKYKAGEVKDVLCVRLKNRKYSLEIPVNLLVSEEYVFLSLPVYSGIFKVSETELVELSPDADGTAADEAFSQRGGGKKSASSAVPDHVLDALDGIPPGFKLVADKRAKGGYRLVRERNRKGVAQEA